MARGFDGSSSYFKVGSAVVSGYPFTMAAWVRSNSITVNQTVISISDDTVGTQQHGLELAGTVAGDPVRAFSVAGTAQRATTTTGFSASTWHHAAGVFTSATDRAAFIDGGSKGTNATSRAPSGLNATDLGRNGDSTPDGFFDGSIAEAAVWNVALTDAEIAILALGYSALLVRPGALVAYWPLLGRHTNEIDVRGGNTVTPTGSPTTQDHCRVIQARRGRSGKAGTTTVAVSRDFALPEEWAQTINCDRSLLAEWSAALARDTSLLGEWSQGLSRDAGLPSEWLATLVRDGVQPGEWATALALSTGLAGEWAQTINRESSVAVEWGVALVREAAIPGEWSSSLLHDASLTAEWMASLARDAVAPSEWSQILVLDPGLPGEWSGTVALAREFMLPGEWSASLVRDVLLSGEWARGVTRDAGLVTQWLATLARDGVLPGEWTGTTGMLARDFTLPVEWDGVFLLASQVLIVDGGDTYLVVPVDATHFLLVPDFPVFVKVD